MAWDAGAPVVSSGREVDGEALRRTHKARLTKDRSPVTILRAGGGGDERAVLGERLCAAVVPKRAAETPVLIKPNLGGMEWFKDPAKNDGDDGVVGRTTDREFVRGIVRCLKARGHAAITIADGFGHGHAEWVRLVKATGYDALAREENVRLVALDDDGVFDVEGDKPGLPLAVKGLQKTHVPTLLMPKVLADHLERGLFISAPKIKAHRFSVFSVAIKGMQGTIQYSDAKPAFHQKWRSHRELGDALKAIKRGDADARKRYVAALEIFAERMADVLELEAPDAVLAEGLPAMGGDGFGKQWPSKEEFVVGGTNPVLVDRVAAELLGFWDNADLGRELLGHKTSPLLEVAAGRFAIDLAAATPVAGDGAALLSSKRPVHLVGMGGFSLHSDASASTPPRARAAVPVPAPAAGDAGAALPELHAVRASAPPRIDGQGSDAPWTKASPVVFDTDWSGAATGIKTEVRAAWDEQGLYALFTLHDAGLSTDLSRDKSVEREKLYEEDCVELMLAPDATQRTRYFEVEVGPHGHFLDLEVDRAKKVSNVAWSSGLAVATTLGPPPRTAIIEVALRSADIKASLKRGARLPLGLYRMEGKAPRRYLAWSPTRTPKPNFHVPEAFGTLVLE